MKEEEITKLEISDSYKTNIQTINQKLKVFHVNINGLTDQKLELKEFKDDIENADIICFTETHLRREMEFPILENYETAYHAVVDRTNYTGRNIKGVSIYVKDNITNTKIEEVINEGGNLIILKIKTVKGMEPREIFFAVCYKEDRESKFKTYDYFENLKQHIVTHKMKDIFIIGDLNGRTGSLNDNEHLNLTRRKSEDQVINKQGRDIIAFCNETSLIIGNGRLEDGKCSYYTLHKGETKKSMIDYLIVSKNIFEKIENFEISEPVPYTDHAPMNITLNINLTRTVGHSSYNKNATQIYSRLEKLRPVKWTNSYATTFDNNIFKEQCIKINHKLQTQCPSNKEIFNQLIHNKNSAAGLSKRTITKGIGTVYTEDIRKSRQLYRYRLACFKEKRTPDTLEELLEAKRQFNKHLKIAKKQRQANKLRELKDAKEAKDHRKYWQLINQNKTKKRKLVTTLNASDFQLQIERRDNELSKSPALTNQNYILNLLNASISKDSDGDELLDSRIQVDEVYNALRKTKNAKASGPDGFTSEIFKNNIQDTVPILTKLFDNILNGGSIPWTTSWTVPIYKSGDKNSLSSYRCINLSSCVEKLLTKIINNRLTKWFEKNKTIKVEQTGFRKGNSVIDNILLLQEIIQIQKNRKAPLYLCFVDFSKAFDSISLKLLKAKLRITLPDSKLLSLMIRLLDNKTYKILYDGKESESFQLENGIPQGDSMSPTLFCLFINDLFDALRQGEDLTDPININEMKISTVIYADDLLLMSQSKEGIVKQLQIVQCFCQNNGLTINYNKTKIMVNNVNIKYSHLKFGSFDNTRTIEIVNEYKYLGFVISRDNKKHVEQLEKNGKKSSFMTAKLLKEFGNINGCFLKQTYEMIALSKMKYGAELIFYNNLSNLNQIQTQFYKRFCHLKNATPTYCLIGEFGINPIEYHFYKAALNYWTKLKTADDTSIVRKLYDEISANIEETQYSKTWCSQIKKLLYDLRLGKIWENQNDNNSNNFNITIKSRLNAYFREQWIKSAKHSHKGLDYLELAAFDCHMKPYLNFVMKDKSVISMLKLRTGNHKLSIEIDRYRNRKAYNECICQACDTGKLEDIYHVMVECPKYSDMRAKTLDFLIDSSKYGLYKLLNNLSHGKLKKIVDFMIEVGKLKN